MVGLNPTIPPLTSRESFTSTLDEFEEKKTMRDSNDVKSRSRVVGFLSVSLWRNKQKLRRSRVYLRSAVWGIVKKKLLESLFGLFNQKTL